MMMILFLFLTVLVGGAGCTSITVGVELLSVELWEIVAVQDNSGAVEVVFNGKGGKSPYIYNFENLPSGWRVQGNSIFIPKNTKVEEDTLVQIVVNIQDYMGSQAQARVVLDFGDQVYQDQNFKVKIRRQLQQIPPQNTVLATQPIQSSFSSSSSSFQYNSYSQQSFPQLQISLTTLKNSLSLQSQSQNSCETTLKQSQSQLSLATSQLTSKESSLEQSQSQLSKYKTELTQKQKQKSQYSRRLATSTQQPKPSSTTLSLATTKFQQCQSNYNRSQETIKINQEQKDQIDAQILEKERNIGSSEEQLVGLEAEREILVQKIIQLKRELIEAEDLQRAKFAIIQQKRNQPTTIKQSIAKLIDQRNRLQSIITKTKATTIDCGFFQKQLDTLLAQANQLTTLDIQREINAIDKRVEVLNGLIETLEKQVNGAALEIAQLNRQISEITNDVQSLKVRCLSFQNSVNAIQENIKKIQEQIKTLIQAASITSSSTSTVKVPVITTSSTSTTTTTSSSTSSSTVNRNNGNNNNTKSSSLQQILKEVERLVGSTSTTSTANQSNTTSTTNRTTPVNTVPNFSVNSTLSNISSTTAPRTATTQTVTTPQTTPTPQTTITPQNINQTFQNYTPLFPISSQQLVVNSTGTGTGTGSFSVGSQLQQIGQSNTTNTTSGYSIDSNVQKILAGQKIDFSQITFNETTASSK